MAYRDFKDLARRTASDKVLRDKAFNIAKNPKYGRYQRGLASTVTNVLIKRWQAMVLICIQMSVLWTSLKNYINQLLENFKKEVYSGFKDNIWGADLADTHLTSKFNKGFRFL